MADQKSLDNLLDAFFRSGLDPTGIDLQALQAVKVDVEQVIEQFRRDEGAFASAIPAFSVWPELRWSRRAK